jgi:hypothetical protein
MMIKTVVESNQDETVIAVVRLQETGRVSLSEVLHALRINKEDWKDTFLQMVITKLPKAETEDKTEIE